MSPEAVFRALLRRWYVLALAAVLSAVGAYHVVRPTPQYLSSTVLVLKPPVTPDQPNQFANLQSSLAVVSYGVVEQLESPAGKAELAAAGVHGSYLLAPRNSGTTVTPKYLIPSLQITAEEATADDANAVVRAVVTVYEKHLTEIQDAEGIPLAGRMSTTQLAQPKAELVTGTKSRGLAAWLLIGTAGGVLGALWADRWADRRRTRRAARAAAAVVHRGQPEVVKTGLTQ